jgi:two-component system phosphate regulon response regulator PhoB
MRNLILVVEDEEPIRDMIKLALELAGFDVSLAAQVSEANHLLANKIPELILLDWMLPDISGIDYITQLKRNSITKNIPIILLTAKAEEESKIKGLETGADDYVTKPFSPRELVARIKTVLRRGLIATPEGILTLAGLQLNTNTQQVTIHQQAIALSPLEFRLLHFFMKHPNRVYTRNQLLTHIWGDHIEVFERTVDVCIRRLRIILAKHNVGHVIKTVRGTGYIFSDSHANIN